MSLPTISPSPASCKITAEPFTPTSYAQYGTCITAPFPPSLQQYPSSSSSFPTPRFPSQPRPEPANQNTALKTPGISPLVNNYHLSTSPSTTTPQISMFSTFPRPPNTPIRVTHLERHPYTSQTFSPLALPAASSSASTYYLVISAPTLKGRTICGVHDPPDVSRIEAFVARGDQAVTYGPGTWHAPMIVVGETRVDFVVMQFANGVAGDDCEIVEVGGEVVVEAGEGDGEGEGAGTRAKL